MSEPRASLRSYTQADEAAAIELWRRTWQAAYPQLDFAARVGWWRERWRNELVPVCRILVLERDRHIVGFVTLDPKTGYLDQIVTAPEEWGGDAGEILMGAAKNISPGRVFLDVNADNSRAIAFYAKHGFVVSGEGVNPRSGAPTKQMSWHLG